MLKCDFPRVFELCWQIDIGILKCINSLTNAAHTKVYNIVHKICKSFFPGVFVRVQRRTGVYFSVCWCDERHETSIVAAQHKRELGCADFPHGWEHLARGNSFIVPHQMAKIGPILGWRTFGWKSSEMLSCNNQRPKPLCNPFTNCKFCLFVISKAVASLLKKHSFCCCCRVAMRKESIEKKNSSHNNTRGEQVLCSSWIKLTICSTSVETICIQHMAVARAHTMVEMTFRAQTLKSSSWRRRRETEDRREAVRGGIKQKNTRLQERRWGERKKWQDVIMHLSGRAI